MASQNCRSTSLSAEDVLVADKDPSGSVANTSFSPVRPVSAMKTVVKKPSSVEFAEEINRLENEGLRLRVTDPVVNLDRSISSTSQSTDSPQRDADKSINTSTLKSPPMSNSTIAALIDVQADQKTIAELRTQLESQQKETERLQLQLAREFSVARALPFGSTMTATHMSSVPLLNSPSKSTGAFSTIPHSDLTSVSGSTLPGFKAFKTPLGQPPPSHLERALKESQDQVIVLRKRLLEANELAEQQKRQFRSTIEELKCKLQDTIVNRDRILDLRKQEANSQEELIIKLQNNVKELQEANKHQEAVLLENSKRLDSLHHQGYLSDSALNQIRLLLSDAERRRGKPFYESDPVSKQNVGMLVHTLESCLQDLEFQIESKQSDTSTLQAALTESRAQHSQAIQNLSKDHQDRFSQLVSDQAKQLESAMERASNAREQSTSLQTQLNIIKKQFEQQLTLRDETIRVQESRLEEERSEYDKDRTLWLETKADLERRAVIAEDQLSVATRAQGDVQRQLSDLESKLDQYQTEVAELQTHLSSVREEKTTLEKHLTEGEQCRERQVKQLQDQRKEISQLERLLTLAKQESEIHLNSQAVNEEKCEEEKKSVNSLTSELQAMSEKAENTSLELERARTEINTLRLEITTLTQKIQVTTSELEATTEAKGHISRMLEERHMELQQAVEERDYYSRLLENKNTELGQLRAERDKVVIQLEENDRNLKTIYQQSSNLSQIVEINSKASENVREEKERLLKKLTDKTVSHEELKLSFENTNRKLKSREKRLKQLEDERSRIRTQSDLSKQEVKKVIEERDKAVKELEHYKYHITMVTDDQNKQLNAMKVDKAKLEKQLKKATTKVKAYEEELMLAEKALHSKTSVDNKAVKVADKMQKEVTAKRGQVDKLQSQLHWLEEKVEALGKEKKLYEVTVEELQDLVDRLTNDNKALCEEVSNHQKKHKDLKVRTEKLQAGLEKAAVKNSCAQRQAQKLEQEIARLKLNHQLEIKEVQSSNQMRRSSLPESCLSPVVGKKTSSESTVKTPQEQSFKAFVEIGGQLKNLLSQVRTLISSQEWGSSKDSPYTNSDGELPSAKPVSRWEIEAARVKDIIDHQRSPKNFDQQKHKTNNSVPDDVELSTESQTPLHALFVSDISTIDSDGTEAGKQLTFKDVSAKMPDTVELYRRLEAKMESLTKMGGSLQRENQEMAELMKVQGRKIQRVKKNDGRSHKKR